MRGTGQHAVMALLGLCYIVSGLIVLVVLLAFRPPSPVTPIFPGMTGACCASGTAPGGGTPGV